ncbi:MAG: hypothetical protein NTV22_03855 [bacterium]|nr:hypothetical protein [bacterium]
MNYIPLCAALALVLAAPAIPALETTELINFVMCDGGSNDILGAESVMGFAIEDDTAYVQVSFQNVPQINRIENISGGQVVTRLMHPANWLAASGENAMTTWYGFDATSNYLQFADTYSDGIWRVDKNTGGLSCYVSKSSVTNTIDSTNGYRFLATYITSPNTGETIFYNPDSRYLMTSAGSNVVKTFISNAQLTNAFGNARCAGGMTFDPNGNLYWGQYESGIYAGIHKRDTNGIMSVLLTKTQMDAVVGVNYPAIGDIFYAPDGQLYIYKYKTFHGCIVTCDPAATNPAATLRMFMSETDLTNSAAHSWQVGELGWYKGGLAWHHFFMGEPKRTGIFAVVPTNAPVLVVSGPAEVAVNSSNVPYGCMLLLTNRWGLYTRYDQTSTAQWSIVGGAPAGVTLDGNFLSVASDVPTNQYITLQAASSYADQALTNTYAVLLVPEPALLALCLLLLCAQSVRSV